MMHLGPQRQLELLMLLALVKKKKISLQEAYIEIKLNPMTLRNLSPLYMSILEGTLILLLISNKGKGKFTCTEENDLNV